MTFQEEHSQLPCDAATCKQKLPTPSLDEFRSSAMCAGELCESKISDRRLVLFRRHASKRSSFGEAPYNSKLSISHDTAVYGRTSSAITVMLKG